MEHNFYHYLNGKRPITVKIDSECISFHFMEEGDREFYSIPKHEWISDKTNRLDREDNWHRHMMMKTWFCEDMKDFIDENTSDK